MKKIKDIFKVGENNIGWVDSSFTQEFGDDDMPEEGETMVAYKLPRSMKDAEIIKEFGIQECTFADVLATLRSRVVDIKDGHSNLFYIKGHPSHVVRVFWGSGSGSWDVYDWYRDLITWGGGGCVFSPATGSGSISSSAALTLNEAVEIVKAAGLKVIKTKIIEEEL